MDWSSEKNVAYRITLASLEDDLFKLHFLVYQGTLFIHRIVFSLISLRKCFSMLTRDNSFQGRGFVLCM